MLSKDRSTDRDGLLTLVPHRLAPRARVAPGRSEPQATVEPGRLGAACVSWCHKLHSTCNVAVSSITKAVGIPILGPILVRRLESMEYF